MLEWRMPVLELKLAVAMMLALFQFGLSTKVITIEIKMAEKSAQLKLFPEGNGFAIVDASSAELIKTGFVTTFENEPTRFQFGEPGMGPSIRLEGVIQDFSKLDFSKGELLLNCKIGEESARLHFLKTEHGFILKDFSGESEYIVHVESD